MAKKTAEHGLRETKGNFQVRGTVLGTKNDRFFTQKDLGDNKYVRNVQFGVKYDVFRDNGCVDPAISKVVYPVLQGFNNSKVYFSKKNDSGKTETKEVKWTERTTFAESHPDWRVIGVTLGLEKGEDEKNIITRAVPFDAAKIIKDKLVDDASVFVRGNLSFRSYTNKKDEKKRMIDFVPSQISLCQDVAFDEDDFEAIHDFNQEIIFTSIAPEEENGIKTGRFVLEGYVVSYTSIEPVSFIVIDNKLAQKFRKGVKPYESIQVHGRIEVRHMLEESVEENEDEWGDTDKMENRSVKIPSIQELIITGAKPSTITQDFSEESVANGLKILASKTKAEKNFGEKKEDDKAPWGETESESDDDMEADW